MVDQYNENLYDDDLTVGAGEYEAYDHTDTVDLFEFSNQDESPTSRLKSLILSIDWEITDEVLMEFNEELVYLEGIWRGEKINLVYVQALQKISKYIYQQKANSHPDAIKLLLKFYYNLEKIISSEDLTGEQKKQILLGDVKRFEGLKRQIARQDRSRELHAGKEDDQGTADQQVNENELLNLKATVLGIDWEITEEDLNDLRQEVARLEEKYAGSRPKLILLQGIGTLGAYIKVNKNNAHGDAFKLLHLFFKSLEKIVKTPISLKEEKEILFAAIEKFNAFKAMLGPAAVAGAPLPGEVEEREDDEMGGMASPEDTDDIEDTDDTGIIQPALSDYLSEESRGFQEEEEAKDLGDDGVINVSSHIDEFFGESSEDAFYQVTEEQVTADFSEEEVDEPHGSDAIESGDIVLDDPEAVPVDDIAVDDVKHSGPGFSVDRERALQGVDVETDADDDSDEEALPTEETGAVAPALGDVDQASLYSVESLSSAPTEGSVDEKINERLDDFFVDEVPSGEGVVEPEYDFESEEDIPALDAGEEAVSDDVTAEADTNQDAFPDQEREVSEAEDDLEQEEVGKDPALEGVNVETEADDESSEPDLPIEDSGVLAPALSDGDETSIYSTESLSDSGVEEGVDKQLSETLDDFFMDEEKEGEAAGEPEYDLGAEIAEPSFEIEAEEQIIEEDGQFDDVAAEVDSNLNAFFGLEQDLEEPENELEMSGDEMPDEDVEIAEEEEVVFELVTPSAEEDDVAADEFLLEISPDPLLAIGQCIDSVCSGFNRKVVQRLESEIGQLQQHWAAKNLEMSFLQLLSTVTRHIERYRFEADPEAYALLKSNYDALGLLDEGAPEQNQEVLFSEISKVLEWQQDLLFKKRMPK